MVAFSGESGLKTGPPGWQRRLSRQPIVAAPLISRRLRGPAHKWEGYRAMAQPNSANDEAHWRKTTKLMLTPLGIWVFFGYIVHMFVKPLNKIVIPILDFPLGFYMA